MSRRPLALATLAAASFALAVVPNARAQVLAYRLPPEIAEPPEPSGGLGVEPLASEAGLSPREADDWLGRDKLYHLGASFGLALGAHVALTEGAGMEAEAARPLAAGFALGIGLAKEYADERRPRRPLFSWKDLAADAAGVALGIAVASL